MKDTQNGAKGLGKRKEAKAVSQVEHGDWLGKKSGPRGHLFPKLGRLGTQLAVKGGGSRYLGADSPFHLEQLSLTI